MMGRWVQFATTPFLVDRTEPFLMQSSSLGQLARFAHAEGVTLRHLDISSARSVVEVIEGMKAVLTFPEWCGSSWDSIDDAFEEIEAGWTFPLVLVIGGAADFWVRDPHLLLQTVMRLAELSRAFSVVGDQFVVVYVADSWGEPPVG